MKYDENRSQFNVYDLPRRQKSKSADTHFLYCIHCASEMITVRDKTQESENTKNIK